MKDIALFVLFACVISLVAHTQRVEVPVEQDNATTARVEVTSIRGVIVDPMLARIPNANLLLQKKEGAEFRDVKSVRSDETGGFKFEEASPGDYRLIATAPGFCEITIPTRLSKDGWPGVKIILPVGATDTPRGYCPSKAKVEKLDK